MGAESHEELSKIDLSPGFEAPGRDIHHSGRSQSID
jgi:hypothetical protein